ncbi:MAG TPA: SDR family oxidoreductase [Acidimicrobiales bacterium]|nr:SDR family oxidoreductase [Acidimicrobiales bacterium]
MADISSKKVAAVTGGGSGIGKACAFALARDGFEVVVVGRRRAVLEEAAAEGARKGLRLGILVGDVSDPEQVNSVFSEIEARFGRLDLLFNNAGTGAPPLGLEELTYDQWSSVVGTNLTGAFLCTQQAFRIMKNQVPQGGRIINNGSLAAHVPRPNAAPYTASKHGITGLTRAAALEGRRYKIACGQIDIGNAVSEMSASAAGGTGQADGSSATEPRFDVEHVAQAVSYMAGLPLEANVLSLTVMATAMPFVGRG